MSKELKVGDPCWGRTLEEDKVEGTYYGRHSRYPTTHGVDTTNGRKWCSEVHPLDHSQSTLTVDQIMEEVRKWLCTCDLEFDFSMDEVERLRSRLLDKLNTPNTEENDTREHT